MKRLVDAILNPLATALEASGSYRVLRRLVPQERFSAGTPATPFTGIILDTETTGMTPGADEVIELGMLKFEYGQDGQIYQVLDTFNRLQQPENPTPAHITAITGITDTEVAGQAIDPAEVEAFVAGAALIIEVYGGRQVELRRDKLTARIWFSLVSNAGSFQGTP